MKKIEVDNTLVPVENNEFGGIIPFTKDDFFRHYVGKQPKGKTYKLHGISFDQYVSSGYLADGKYRKQSTDYGFGMNGFLRSLTMAYDRHRS